MKEHPIIFSAPMVRALLADRKFVTRRLSKQWLRVKAGDLLWVRETWAVGKCADGLKPSMLAPRTWRVDNGGLWLDADNTEPAHPISPRGKSRVSLFMPRWASRILLECEQDARVERLQDITEKEARAEGVSLSASGAPWINGGQYSTFKCAFNDLWGRLHTKPGERWRDNPEVVRVGRFRRIA